MSTRHTLALAGCAPVPLAHYLKALGILRLVSEQVDPSATGHWHRDQFMLQSTLDREGLMQFFLEDYRPTPVMAPWNGGSGFYPKDNSKALEALLLAESTRLQPYSKSLRAAQTALKSMNLGEKPTPEQKATLLLLCRNLLPDEVLQWLDAAYVLTDDGAKYPPLLGTGGNDGRLEFTNNFMQRITEVIDAATGHSQKLSSQRLAVSLFAEAIPIALAKAPVGQFLPGTAGGANATSGFDAPSTVNPWDFILMIEGALLFASANVKKLESTDQGTLAYPFSVRQAGVGYASAASADESASRAEMWMPIWKDRPVTLPELGAIFAEGRAQVGERTVKNGVDFARAVVSLGVDRGLDEFQRYGFQVRNGLSYFATPLTRVVAKRNGAVDLLSEIDPWLDRFRRAASKDTAPASIRRALNHLEERIFDLCINNSTERFLALFLALGQCEKAVARSLEWAKESFLQPLQGLSKAWLVRSWAHSVEFRLAGALATLTGKFGKEWIPFRAHLEPVDSWYNKKQNTIVYRWSDVVTNHVQWSEGSLPKVLNDILGRRLILNEETEKRFEIWASIHDLKSFIEAETDDVLLSDLLWSMSLINWRESAELPAAPKARPPVPPTLFAALRLCYPPIQKDLPEKLLPVPVVPGIHRHAAQGNGTQASQMAVRRLRASGYRPIIREIPAQGDYVKRTAAALIFPISGKALEALVNQVTRPTEETQTRAI